MGSKNATQNDAKPIPKYISCLFAKTSFASETRIYEIMIIGIIKNG